MSERGLKRRKRKVETALIPPDGVKVQKPDNIEVETALNWSAPSLAQVEMEGRENLDLFVDAVNVKTVEKRITLLARLIIENSLWNNDEMSAKERHSAAIDSIRLFEGKGMELWKSDGDDIPKSQEVLHDEMERLAGRVQKLVKMHKDNASVQREMRESAVKIVEAEKQQDILKASE